MTFLVEHHVELSFSTFSSCNLENTVPTPHFHFSGLIVLSDRELDWYRLLDGPLKIQLSLKVLPVPGCWLDNFPVPSHLKYPLVISQFAIEHHHF